MPGLVGFAAGRDRGADRRTLRAMRESITHQDFYEHDALSIDDQVCATRTHTNVAQPRPQPYVGNGLRVWFDGEIYDRGSHGWSRRARSVSDPRFIAELFQGKEAESVLRHLREVGGVYSAVVHDPGREKLYLVTDRHGLGHLYWTVHRERLAWASELKAFLALPGFAPRIDSQAVDEFLGASHFKDDRTWFENVRLLPSGSVLTWDLRQRSLRTDRYWCWDEIRPLSGAVDEAEVVEEIGRLFRQAVRRRCCGGERIGVHLSGGLDSRAIVAAMPERAAPLHLFTWGRPGCHDLRLAARVSQVRGAVHHAVELNQRNWLDPRPAAVWWLDGQMNILDMHYLHTAPLARQFIDVDLNGFLGGNVLGGEYLDYPGSDEIAVIETRGRRHIWGGLRLGWMFYGERPVFFDNDLLTFTLSVPANLRRNSRVYNKMLLRFFPQYYERIPWQRTGCPIAWPPWLTASVWQFRRVRYGLSKRLRRLGVNLPDRRAYADYDSWLRQEPAGSWARNLLFDSEAAYPRWASRQVVEHLWQRHQRGDRLAEDLCRFLTFEVWLRQIFRGELRPQPNQSSAGFVP